MSRLGEAPVPVGAPVPAPPWLGADLGHVEKPRHAYDAWRKDVREHAALWCLPVRPIVHPTAERLLADLEAAIAARPAGWWRRLLPAGAKWRDVFMQSGQP